MHGDVPSECPASTPVDADPRRSVTHHRFDFPGRRAPRPASTPRRQRHPHRRPRVGRRRCAARCCAVHGGFDFARTYDLFAPRLAAGGWRVVSVGPARPRRQRTRRAVLVGRRHARRARPSSTTSARPSAPRRRPLQGRRVDDAARRRPAVPVHPPGQHGRHPVQAEHPGRRRTRAHQDDVRRHRQVARSPPPHRRPRNASPARSTSSPSDAAG